MKIALVCGVILLSGCAELGGYVGQQQDLSRVDICNKYIAWKYAQLPSNGEQLTEAQKQTVNRRSEPFLAYCDKDPATTPNISVIELQARANIMSEEIQP